MVTESKAKKILFLKCKKSVLEIVGWKVSIFLPQNFAWRFFVISTVIVSVVLNITAYFYLVEISFLEFADIFCDLIYLVDVVLATMHYTMKKTRKLRSGRKRHVIFLIIDYLSLLPLKLANKRLMFQTQKKNFSEVSYFHLNMILRIYQIPKCFSDAKKSTYKVKTYFIVIIFELFTYFVLLTHFFSCFLVLHFDEAQKKRCWNDLPICVIENELLTFSLLGQCYFPPFSEFPLKTYKVLLIFVFFIGYIFTYGYVIPLVLFVVLKILSNFFEYCRKWIQLNVSVKNFTADKELKQRILTYFHYVWTYGKGDKHPEILKVFPLCFRKNIFCDMHWDAIRHSELFRDLSMGCKRSLALYMKTEFVLPDTILYEKNTTHAEFLYLESGILQIMAVENNNSPVLNLSSGTVLGEISFFLQMTCRATVHVAEFSIIHLLNYRDFFRVFSDYPKDLKKVFHKVQMRLKVAKSTNLCKTEVSPLFWDHQKSNVGIAPVKEGNIKWIKQQYRILSEIEEAEKLKKIHLNAGTLSKYQLLLGGIATELQHTSLHLPLLCINDKNLNKYDTVCIKMSFPWMMHPHCHFLHVWKTIMSVLMVITVLLYPALIGWFSYPPDWFIKISVLITLMYIIDVFVQLFTAVKMKNVIISKFSSVMYHNLSCLSFYADILAAFPGQVLIYVYRNEIKTPFVLNLFLVNTLLKSYKLIPVINKWTYSPKPEVFIRALIKNFFLLFVFTYWSAMMFHITGVNCTFYECGDEDWYNRIVETGKFDPTIASISKAVFFALDIPEEISETNLYHSFLISMFFLQLFHFFYIALLTECIASYVMEFTYDLEYKKLMTFIYGYMGRRKMVGQIRNRVLQTMQFLWDYDRGYYITQNIRMLDDLSTDLKKDIARKWLIPMLASSRLFDLEDESFHKELCQKAEFLALPAKSLLQTFGIQPMRLYVIHKGFIQINSFIAGDLRMNISTPILLKEKDIFPVIDALSQSPAAVTAIAVTDCQLIVLDLESVLSTTISHGSFRDLIEALRKTNLSALSTAKLGVSPIPDIIIFDRQFYEEVFKKLKCLGAVLKFLLGQRGIESRSDWYIHWEFGRVVCILISLISWPLVFGVCNKLHSKSIIIKVLFALDCFSLIDFYIRFHIAYYNKLGVYVTHPLTTSWHYLTTSFVVDFIAFVPSFHICYIILHENYKFHLYMVICHILVRSIALYRFLGLLSFLKSSARVKYSIELFKCLFFIALGLHYYASLMVYCSLEGLKKPQDSLTTEDEMKFNNPLNCYLHELIMAFSKMMKNPNDYDYFDLYALLASLVLAVSGVMSQIYIYSFLTLTSTTSNKNLTTYQYYMKSFVQYLNTQKAEDAISTLAIEHFEHQWQKQRGYDPHNIFSKFPQTLHEDIVFPLYKKSLNGVKSLSKADGSFYRTLSRYIQEVHLQKGSIIIFEKQVQDGIFFIHKGKCYVENLSIVLTSGSMIGDIKRQGVMKNTITAKSDVHLLRVPSEIFFVTINNFYTTKMEYELAVANADDFMKSSGDEEKQAVLETLSVEKKDLEEEFLFVTDEKYLEESLYEEKKRKKKILNPESKKARVLDLFFMLDAYITIILIPIFIALRLFSPYVLSTIYILDIIWVFKIIVTTRTAYHDKKIGDFVSNKRAILLRYVGQTDGLISHVLSVLPIEVLAFSYFGIPLLDEYCFITSICYINRLLRTPFIYTYIHKGSKKLLANFYKGLLGILMTKIALINFCVCCDILIIHGKKTELLKCYTEMHYSHLEALSSSYLSILNVFVGGGIFIDLPTTPLESMFRLFISIWSLLSKAFFLNQVLLIIYVTHETKSDEMMKLEQLEKYLSVRDVSPALFQRTQKYFCDLLDSFNEGAEPSFLNHAPSYIKRTIMQDLYTQHLSNCYVFQGLEDIFLTQLAERLQRFIFFPGDYITEKGDVDHCMYFVHKGEVFCIEADENIKALELTVDVIVTGEYFGVLQGIFLAYPHTNSYRAKTMTDILVLSYNKWADLRAAYPEISESIYNKCMHYDINPRRSTPTENKFT